jgi:hypothetical protein
VTRPVQSLTGRRAPLRPAGLPASHLSLVKRAGRQRGDTGGAVPFHAMTLTLAKILAVTAAAWGLTARPAARRCRRVRSLA